MKRLKIYDSQCAAEYTQWDLRPYLEQLVEMTNTIIDNRRSSPNQQALYKLHQLQIELRELCRLLADEIEVQL